MYSIVELEDIVKLEANQLDNIYDSIKKNLINNYEKKILGRINSYIIKISNIDTSSIKNGIISDINGSVSYKVRYTAIIFEPKNGHLNITITKSNEVGIWGYPTMIYTEDEVKKIKNVSIECMCPKDIISDKFSYENLNWISKNNKDVKLTIGTEIIVNIMNYSIESNKISLVGEIV